MLLPLVATLGGCGDVATEQDQRELIEKVQDVQVRMHQRYAASQTIQTAIAFGDLAGAQRSARTIAGVYEPAIRAEWQPYLAQLRAAANQIAIAPDLATAARMSALLGRRCAQCHDATHAKILFPAAPLVGPSPRLASQMASHQVAAMLLWEGLAGGQPERYARGARMLVESRIAIVAESDTLPPELAAADDVERLHLHARRAVDAKTLDDRVTAYAEILATCAGCHRTVRD